MLCYNYYAIIVVCLVALSTEIIPDAAVSNREYNCMSQCNLSTDMSAANYLFTFNGSDFDYYLIQICLSDCLFATSETM